MYRPSSGRITVDGTDLAGIGPARWRAATTGAFQDCAQFQMTLGDGAGDLPRTDDRDAVQGALDGGRVAGAVDHPALLARDGIYAELFTLRAEGYLGR